jgi:hypothetical protein
VCEKTELIYLGTHRRYLIMSKEMLTNTPLEASFGDNATPGSEQWRDQPEPFAVVPLSHLIVTSDQYPVMLPLSKLKYESDLTPDWPAGANTDTAQCEYNSATNSCKIDCGQTTSTCVEQATCDSSCSNSAQNGTAPNISLPRN